MSRSTGGTSALTSVWLVARREIRTRLLAKSNIVSLSILVAIIAGGIFAIDFFTSGDDEADDGANGSADAAFVVSVADETTDLIPFLESSATAQALGIDTSGAPGPDVDAELTGTPESARVTVEEEADPDLVQIVTEAMRAYVLDQEVRDLGGDAEAVSSAIAAAVPQVISQDDSGPTIFGPDWLIAVMAISVLLFLLISTGSLISMGVVEEKTSRVVEILLATIRPSQLLAGKILGIGVVGLVSWRSSGRQASSRHRSPGSLRASTLTSARPRG